VSLELRIGMYRQAIADLISDAKGELGLSAGHAIPMYLNAVLMELDRLRKEEHVRIHGTASTSPQR